MKVILFGATGMIGQGALRECLLDPEVEAVLAVGRTPTGQAHEKLRELAVRDPLDYREIESKLAGYDACLYCLGVSAGGMSEADYTRITYDATVAAAEALLRQNPGLVMIFISGAGTDSSEKGRTMWARVKGRAENTLLRMPFRAAYMFRPGYIQPTHGSRSKTRSYRMMYAVAAPLFPLWRAIAPNVVSTNEQLAKAMLVAAKRGAPKPVLEVRDINALAS